MDFDNFKGVHFAEEINGGDCVLCDSCNADGDEVDSEGNPVYMGGGSVSDGTAYCQACFDRSVKEYGAKVLEIYDPAKSFGDNVRSARLRDTGTSDCVIRIYTFD